MIANAPYDKKSAKSLLIFPDVSPKSVTIVENNWSSIRGSSAYFATKCGFRKMVILIPKLLGS